MRVVCKCKKETTSLMIEADFADPIWCDICGWNLDMEAFKLSDKLKDELGKWIREYAKFFMLWEDEIITRKDKDELVKRHNELGLELTEKVRNELGDKYSIRFIKAVI